MLPAEKLIENTREFLAGANRRGQKAKKAAQMRQYRHGLSTLKAGISKLGSRAIDGRFRVGRALAQWRKELINDLGGEQNISTQQRTIIELASTSKLLLGSIDAWLLSRPSLFQRDQKTLLPVVLQRQQLADGLARYLNQLGLERRHKVKTLNEILDDTPANGNGAEAEENGKDEST